VSAPWIEADGTPVVGADMFVPLQLLEAMRGGGDVASVASPLLYANLPTICKIFKMWLPDMHNGPRYSLRDCLAPAPSVNDSSVFFSGGVDGMYSLLAHRDSLTNMVMVHGFDVPLDEREKFARAEASARELAEVLGKRLIVVRTNLRNVWKPVRWELTYGAALAFVGLALQQFHSKVLIGSSSSIANLRPWGSHPLLDPLWSTEAVQFVHDGLYVSRVEKTALVASHPEALKRLRVCWQDGAAFNCGRCEKCLRTMVVLQGFGKLAGAPFPAKTVDPRWLRDINRGNPSYWRELFAPEVALPAELSASVTRLIRDLENSLPGATSLRGRARRLRAMAKQTAKLWGLT